MPSTNSVAGSVIVAIAGSRTDSGRIAAKFAQATGGAPQATVIVTGAKVPAVHAAFANAIASHSIGEVGWFVFLLALSAAVLTVAMSGYWSGARARWAKKIAGKSRRAFVVQKLNDLRAEPERIAR